MSTASWKDGNLFKVLTTDGTGILPEDVRLVVGKVFKAISITDMGQRGMWPKLATPYGDMIFRTEQVLHLGCPTKAAYDNTDEVPDHIDALKYVMDSKSTKPCTCDFHTVIMRTGCTCGGK